VHASFHQLAPLGLGARHGSRVCWLADSIASFRSDIAMVRSLAAPLDQISVRKALVQAS